MPINKAYPERIETHCAKGTKKKLKLLAKNLQITEAELKRKCFGYAFTEYLYEYKTADHKEKKNK